MRSGILQVFLAAVVLFQVVVSEKDSNKTEIDDEKDIIKEETGQINFHMHPRSSGYDGSKSSSRSKSSSKSSGSGSGKGYGYGSNGPEDKGPQGGSHGGYRGPSYGPSYEDESKGSSEVYKSSREEGSYHGGSHHRDSSPEYSTSYEEQYNSKGRHLPTYQSGSGKGQSKTYSSTPNQNRGYSSSGRYNKNDDLPSVSPDGFIESHSNQQTSAEKFDAQEYGPQGYAGPKGTYGGESYQGYQGGSPLTSSHGYNEYSGRDESTGYSGPTFGGFTPMLTVGSPKHGPYSNVISGKGIDEENMSFFVKQVGGAGLPEIQAKNSYVANDAKLGLGKGQQQGFLLFPVVPKGIEGGNTGYGGRNAYSGVSEGKAMAGLVKDTGYKGPAYTSHQPESYGPQHQGREYGGSSGGYVLGGHQVENAAYQQDKGGYGQSHKLTPEGKHILAGTPGVYGSSGSYPKQHGPSAAAGHRGQATYGISGGHGAGAYDDGAKYGAPVTDVKASGHGAQYPVKGGAPVSEGYGYTIAGAAGDSYKNVGVNVEGYGGSQTAKDHPRDYRGVVSFNGGQSGMYAGGDAHRVPVESHGKSGANYESSGPPSGVGYGTGHGKNYATEGVGYGDLPTKGVEAQPVAPRDKKSKSVAIILQKQPLNVPSLGPVTGFGPELDAQFKAPFKDYLGGGGFDFNLGSYGAGISNFDSRFKGRDTPSEFLHGLDGYGGDFSSFNYGNANAKFY